MLKCFLLKSPIKQLFVTNFHTTNAFISHPIEADQAIKISLLIILIFNPSRY